jgi:hypothetical protein
MPLSITNLAYLVAAVLFIFGLKGLAHPRTAVRGNMMGALGMLLAVVVTLLDRNIIDFKMSIQEDVEAPRIWTMGIKGTPGEKLIMEKVFPEQVRAELETRGHIVFPVNRIAGGMNGVLRDSYGMLHGGACWRADGAPMGVSGGRTVPELLEPDPPY